MENNMSLDALNWCFLKADNHPKNTNRALQIWYILANKGYKKLVCLLALT